MTAITTVTAQNSVGVQAIAPMSGSVVARQIASCIDDIGVDAVKIGMLHDEEIITATAEALCALPLDVPVILDPVMIATSGSALIAPEAIACLRETLFPMATLLTPNLPELGHLVGRSLTTSDHMIDAAQELSLQTGASVLAKGGHTSDERIIDMLIQPGRDPGYFDHARLATSHTHGTGCTLASAIATLIGHGQTMDNAVRLGRNFVLRAIEAAPGFGAGNGPLGHQAVRSLAD